MIAEGGSGGGEARVAGALRVAVLTVSDACSAGTREDASGERIRAWVDGAGYVLAGRSVVPDETTEIVRVLLDWTRGDATDLILTTGGTGLSPRDVTPEATLAVLDRQAPGLAERIRAEGMKSTPFAALSRGVAGIRGRTLILNLPGSPRAVGEGLDALEPLLQHAMEVLGAREAGPHPVGRAEGSEALPGPEATP